MSIQVCSDALDIPDDSQQAAPVSPEDYYAVASNGNHIPPRVTKRLKAIRADVRNTGDDEQIRVTVTHKKQRHWTVTIGITTCACLVGLMFWQFTVVPWWTRYQKQLACVSSHICMATTVVSPGKPRTFICYDL